MWDDNFRERVHDRESTVASGGWWLKQGAEKSCLKFETLFCFVSFRVIFYFVCLFGGSFIFVLAFC